jgi:hypothetical protein
MKTMSVVRISKFLAEAFPVRDGLLAAPAFLQAGVLSRRHRPDQADHATDGILLEQHVSSGYV